ncbi:MAG: hypothetical protein KDC44_13715 [Phaeodactylibacter sp.]|nr:hypothetical protein [Phaeodactylibacter sp.]
MKFSVEVLNNGISSIAGELAWKREQIFKAIDELFENGFAILGGEVWALVEKSEYASNIPPLTSIDSEKMVLGVIDCKDGKTAVFGWETEKKPTETWAQYVLSTKIEAIRSVEELDVENEVAPKYKNQIYYHLVFVNEQKYKNSR